MQPRTVLTAIALGYLCLLAGAYAFQRRLLYFPNPNPVSAQMAAAHGLEELPVTTEDGLNLKGWYAPSADRKLTIVYFHGNADGLQAAAPIAAPYVASGYGFLVAEYRGYSGMPGCPSEKGLYADARAYIRKLIALGVNENDIVLFGHSLGSGVATQMALEFHIRGLVLIAPFLDIPQIAEIRYPYLPVDFLARDRFENFKKISNVPVPVFIAVGGHDSIVPAAQGKELFALANQPKQLFFSPFAGHNNLFQSELYPATFEWLRKVGEQK